jgi:hypothetical protein
VPPESLDELVQSLRARVSDELEAQLRALTARHEAAIAAARRDADAESEHRIKIETERIRVETERRVQAETEERVRAETEERVRAETEERLTAAAAPPLPPEDVSSRMLAAFARIGSAATASDMLTAIDTAASECVREADLFVGPRLDRWPSNPDGKAAPEIVREALASSAAVRKDGAIAAPLLLDGETAAVLYTASVESDRDARALEGIATFAAAQLGALTAVRTAQAHRWIRASSSATGTPGDGDDAQAARRYARLLVSEIKLYNENAVNEGRTRRDLSRRLGTEIDRARRLYEERVPSTVAERGRYFQHELIQTLAGGDATLFG